MTKWGVGAIGGALVVIVSLFTADIVPIKTYFIVSHALVGKVAFIGWFIRLAALALVGGLWVKWSKEDDPLKAFQLGIAAPAAIAAMMGISSEDSGRSVPVVSLVDRAQHSTRFGRACKAVL